jgi:hypothetical protein
MKNSHPTSTEKAHEKLAKKSHCCPNISGFAKFILVLFVITLLMELVQTGITTEQARESKQAAILAYAKQLGLAKDISADFKCINNQVHYATGSSLLGSNYALLHPMVACDAEYYAAATDFKPSYWLLKLSGALLIVGLLLSLIRLKIDPELRAFQVRKTAEKRGAS